MHYTQYIIVHHTARLLCETFTHQTDLSVSVHHFSLSFSTFAITLLPSLSLWPSIYLSPLPPPVNSGWSGANGCTPVPAAASHTLQVHAHSLCPSLPFPSPLCTHTPSSSSYIHFSKSEWGEEETVVCADWYGKLAGKSEWSIWSRQMAAVAVLVLGLREASLAVHLVLTM